MNRELYIAFCLSLAVHAAVVSVCPAPSPTISSDNGEEQDIVVIGVVEMTSPPVEEMKHPEPPEPITVVDPAPPPTCEEIALLPQPPEKEQKQEPPEKILQPPADVPTPGQEGSPGKEELSQGQIQDIRSRYLTRVMQKLEAVKKYPPPAYRRGIEGTTEIAFTILANGNAEAVETRRSSRRPVLDNAARSMITRASPFESLPKELGLRQMQLIVPVAFRIEEAKPRMNLRMKGEKGNERNWARKEHQ